MNSPNKLYEELLKEHPELKNSQENIPEIILSLQELNPAVQIDQNFKLSLKKRLDSIAQYNPSKKSWYFGFLKYFVPVFTFWFVIFGFVYFSQDFKQPVQQEIWWFQPLETLDQNKEELEWNTMMLKWASKSIPKNHAIGNSESNQWKKEGVIPESMIIQSESIEIESSTLQMLKSVEIIDEFKNICLEYNGLVKDLLEGERICILEKVSCLESDFTLEKCLIKK
jgi:hypothetical protein